MILHDRGSLASLHRKRKFANLPGLILKIDVSLPIDLESNVIRSPIPACMTPVDGFGFIPPLSAKGKCDVYRLYNTDSHRSSRSLLGFRCPVATVICATDTSRSLRTCLPGNWSPAGGAPTWGSVPCGHSGIIPSLSVWVWRTLWPLSPLTVCRISSQSTCPSHQPRRLTQNCRKVIKNETWSGRMHKENETSLRCIIPWVAIQHKHLRLKSQTELTWTTGPFARCKGNRKQTKKLKNKTSLIPIGAPAVLSHHPTKVKKVKKVKIPTSILVPWANKSLSAGEESLVLNSPASARSLALGIFFPYTPYRGLSTYNLLRATPKSSIHRADSLLARLCTLPWGTRISNATILPVVESDVLESHQLHARHSHTHTRVVILCRNDGVFMWVLLY